MDTCTNDSSRLNTHSVSLKRYEPSSKSFGNPRNIGSWVIQRISKIGFWTIVSKIL